MNRLALLFLLCFCTPLLSFCQNNVAPKPRVLVFSKTKGFRHESIGVGKTALHKLGTDNNFDVDTTENADAFTGENLKKYKAVVFLSTTGDALNDAQQSAFEEYIRGGNGYVGIHAATDTEYEWPWYNKLVGAYFESHPKQQNAVLQVVNKTHPSTSFLPNRWQRYDEWYNFKNFNPDVKVLLKLDETSYQGGNMNNNHPMAWYHAYDGGRAFYTALGHTDASYSEPLFLRHVLAGIQYAMGDKKAK
jgi:type 1 glutamine amidotransferase